MATTPVARRGAAGVVAEFSSVGHAKDALRDLEAEDLPGIEFHLYAFREREPDQALGDAPHGARPEFAPLIGVGIGSLVFAGLGGALAAPLATLPSTPALLALLAAIGGSVGLVAALFAVRAGDRAPPEEPVARIEVRGTDEEILQQARDLIEHRRPEHVIDGVRPMADAL